MVTVAQQHQDYLQNNEAEEQNGAGVHSDTNEQRGVTIISGIDDGETTIDYPQDSVASSSSEGRGHGTDAVCVRSESYIRRLDQEDASHTSSTQYSDVDDSLEGDELESWSNDLNVPVSLEQHFDNGVSLPISEIPNFGDVSVKNSANVHFGNKTFYNGPVTIKQIVYSNPNSTDESGAYENEVSGDGDDIDKIHKFTQDGYTDSTTNAKTVGSRKPEDDLEAGHWCALLLTWRCVALICAMGSCLVASVVVSVVLLSRNPNAMQRPDPVFAQIHGWHINGITTKLRFVERDDWIAQPPKEPLAKLNHPVPYVIISHTATDFCKIQSECVLRVRLAQTFHMESRNWSDIAYNFLVGGDGYAYVGRSWDSVGAHSYGYNTKSIGISFIGTFNTIVPPDHQLEAAQQLIDYGVRGGKIAPDYKLLAHRQISATLSPGDALFNVLKTWPHWSPTP